MRRPVISLVVIFAVAAIGLWVVIYDGFISPPEKMERDPDQWQTYRAYVNHGIAARDAGKYSEAITSLLYTHQNAPHSSKIWLVSTVNLAMCCEVLGQYKSADSYYMQAGKFCNLANNMRTAGAWRRMRREIEENNESNETDWGRADSSPAEPFISSEDKL